MQETYLHPIIGSTFATIFSTPDKERGSIFSTCINKLSIFKDPRVMVNIKKTDIVPKDLMNNRISLYLITPPKAIQMTKPLFRLIITQTIYELTDKMEFNNRKKVDEEKVKKPFDFKEKMENFIYKDPPKNPETLKNKKVLFLIDEFPALGNLSLFEQALAYIGGYGLKSLLIVQSINQLNKIYGKDNSIIDNCRVQLYFTPNDKDTPKMISDMMVLRTEKVITRFWKRNLNGKQKWNIPEKRTYDTRRGKSTSIWINFITSFRTKSNIGKKLFCLNIKNTRVMRTIILLILHILDGFRKLKSWSTWIYSEYLFI